MSGVGVLMISHSDVASALLKAVKQALAGRLPLCVATIELEANADPQGLKQRLKKVIQSIDQGSGVLILTDLFGATPSNIASSVKDRPNVRIITGLNLPMLLRVMNYPNLDVGKLAEKAFTGGMCGIVAC